MKRVVHLVAITLLFVAADNSVRGESIFWTSLGEPSVFRAQSDGGNMETFVSPGDGQLPTGVAVDTRHGYLYWTSHSNDTVCRTKLDGTGAVELVLQGTSGQPSFSGLAVDVNAGRLYWTVPSQGTIQRANTDGSSIETIVSGLSQPMGIVVDYAHQGLLWTDTSTGTISSSDLDGANVVTRFAGLNAPLGIAIDDVGQSLYWTEANKIRHHTAAAGVQDVLTGLGRTFDLEIDQGDRMMYWSSPDEHAIYRANLDGSGAAVILSLGTASPGYLALAVPEPSTLVLMGAALPVLLITRLIRRRRGIEGQAEAGVCKLC